MVRAVFAKHIGSVFVDHYTIAHMFTRLNKQIYGERAFEETRKSFEGQGADEYMKHINSPCYSESDAIQKSFNIRDSIYGPDYWNDIINDSLLPF